MSTLAWLAYSEAERQRTLEVIHMLAEKQTLDELGIGRIRDALAELLFPGTSTIQTRARYFLFVPWLYRDLEARTPHADADAAGRRIELRLLDALLAGAADDEYGGIIGIRSRHALTVLPSSIYWYGLGAWGIRRYPGHRRSYHRLLERVDRRYPQLDDTQERVPDGLPPSWDPGLPPRPPDLLEHADFILSPAEAQYLQERVTMAQPRSAFTELVAFDGELPEVPYPWELPTDALATLSEHNRTYLEQAELFSLALNGATLLYNLMLARAAQRAELDQEYEERFADWAAEAVVQRDRLAAWRANLDQLWEIARIVNPRVPSVRERHFVETWTEMVLTRDPATLAADQAAQNLITERERELKRGSARLFNRTALEEWGGVSSPDRLRFRWPQVSRMIDDIRRGLGRGSRTAPEELLA